MVNPIAKRVSGLMGQLSMLYSHMNNKDFLARQIMIILDAVREEVEDDPRLFEHPAAQLWLINFGKLMAWTATGDLSDIPKELYPVIEAIEGVKIVDAEQIENAH